MVKKKFPKKEGVTFKLVHRSQHDPQYVDENASQRILMPVDIKKSKATNAQRNIVETFADDEFLSGGEDEGDDDAAASGSKGISLTRRSRKPSERGEVPEGAEGYDDEDGTSQTFRAKYGIDTDETDTYDYGKHMKVMGAKDGKFVSKDGKAPSKLTHFGIMDSNPDAFESTYEEEIGLLARDLSVSGIRPDWDPEIIEALDMAETGDVDEDWTLDDNFVVDAVEETDDNYKYRAGADPSERAQFTHNEYLVRPGDSSDDYDEDDDDFDDGATTKSRFTEYSMTSSVNFRNKGLSGLDDQFEDFFEQYDESQMGELEQNTKDNGASPTALLSEIMDDFLNEKAEAQKENVQVRNEMRKEMNEERQRTGRKLLGEVESEGEDEYVDMEMPLPNRLKEERWDCESVLSTYSNLENHPSVIREGGMTRKQRAELQNRRDFTTSNADAADGAEAVRSHAASKVKFGGDASESASDDEGGFQLRADKARSRTETTEERRDRKKLLKQERAEKRQSKKETKNLFKAEKGRQTKIRIDKKKNVQGVDLIEGL